MNNRWMKMSVLALSLIAITDTLYADDQVVEASTQNSVAVPEVSTTPEVMPTTNSVQEQKTAPTTEGGALNLHLHQLIQKQIKQLLLYRKKKVMRVKKQIYKKYLLQMSVNTH